MNITQERMHYFWIVQGWFSDRLKPPVRIKLEAMCLVVGAYILPAFLIQMQLDAYSILHVAFWAYSLHTSTLYEFLLGYINR